MIRKTWRLARGSALLRNSIILFAGTMFANLINYLFHFVMGRMVEPSVYGEVESIVSLLAIVSVPGAAITLVAARFAATAKAKGNPAESRAVFSFLNRNLLKYGLPFFLSSLLLTPYVARFLRIEYASVSVVFLFGMMFLSFFSSAATGILQGWQRFFSVGSIQAVNSIVKLLFSVIFVWVGFRTDGIVGAFFLAGIASYVVARMVIRRIDHQDRSGETSVDDVATPDLSAFRPYAVLVLFGSLSIAILGNADMIIAKYHLIPDEAGLYGALFIVAKTIFFAGGILGSVLFSMSAEEHDRNGGVKKDSKLFHHALFLSVLFVIASVGFFALFPEFVLRVFFGSRYLAGAPFLGWFALGSGLYVLVNFFQQYLLSVHRTRVVWGTLVFSILGAIAMFFLAHDVGSLVRYVVYTQTAALLVSAFHYLREVGYNKKSKVENP